MNGFQQVAAAIYLASGLGALLGLALPAIRLRHAAAWGLSLGVVIQAVALAQLHTQDPVPSLADLPYAISFTAWIAVIALLMLMWRFRLAGLAAAIGPIAFLALLLPSLGSRPGGESALSESGPVPHAHVLLSAAGLGLLGISGLSGAFYLLEHRWIKKKRVLHLGSMLPSLEALDRVNVATLAMGFPLLTLGLITGSLWIEVDADPLSMSARHAHWTLIAWGIYAGLAAARFMGRQSARQAAATAVGGFVFLLFAVVGVEVLT